MWIAGLAILAFGALMAVAPRASAAEIDSTSPFDRIIVNEYLSCQIDRAETFEFDRGSVDQDDYCGTFASVDFGGGDVVFGDPEINPPVQVGYLFDDPNQTLTGDGTAANPYKLVTVVYVVPTALDPDALGSADASPAVEGQTTLRITQTDTYVNGDEFYRTDIDVQNTLGDDVSATLYHAGDCRVEGFDSGYAVEDDSGNGPVFCTPIQQLVEVFARTAAITPQGPDPAILGFVPVDPEANFREATIGTLFSEINGDDLIDDCENCGLNPFEDDPVDNGVGLSWPIELGPEESMHVCFLTVDSYAGNVPSIPSSCTPESSTPPATVAQQPPSCKLRISRARVFLFRNHPRLRLVARYRSAEPADVEIDYVAVEGGNKVKLGEVTRHFNRHGLFRLRKELSEQQADELWTTDRFIVHFKIPGEPGFCSRRYTKKLTVPRIVEGQRVVFQEDSTFGPGSPGHPGQ